jgi:hypothetical protein
MPGKLCGVLGRLALGVVKVGRHGNHRADEFTAHRGFGALAQHLEDFSRHLDRALYAGNGFQLHHAGRINKTIRQAGDVIDIGNAAPHKALGRRNGVMGI